MARRLAKQPPCHLPLAAGPCNGDPRNIELGGTALLQGSLMIRRLAHEIVIVLEKNNRAWDEQVTAEVIRSG